MSQHTGQLFDTGFLCRRRIKDLIRAVAVLQDISVFNIGIFTIGYLAFGQQFLRADGIFGFLSFGKNVVQFRFLRRLTLRRLNNLFCRFFCRLFLCRGGFRFFRLYCFGCRFLRCGRFVGNIFRTYRPGLFRLSVVFFKQRRFFIGFLQNGPILLPFGRTGVRGDGFYISFFGSNRTAVYMLGF